MNLLGNLIWLLFGGLVAAIGYFAGGIVLCLTIIGIPFGIQAFKLGVLMLWPFGKEVVSATDSSGCLSVILNVVWLVFFGLGLVIVHIVFGVLLCITIIGIPFGRQHFKMVEISLLPFGKRIVEA